MMRPEFSNHEEWQDLRDTWAEQPDEDASIAQIVAAMLLCIALIAAAFVLAVAGWDWIAPGVETFAPTAAEVMADGFDIERKTIEASE